MGLIALATIALAAYTTHEVGEIAIRVIRQDGAPYCGQEMNRSSIPLAWDP